MEVELRVWMWTCVDAVMDSSSWVKYLGFVSFWLKVLKGKAVRGRRIMYLIELHAATS